MKTRITLFLVAVLVIVAMSAQADQFNQRDQNILVFPIGDVNADATAPTPFTIRIPQAIKIDAAYFVNNGAISADATSTVVVTLKEDGSSMGTYSNAATAAVDDTPVAMTITDTSADAGSLLAVTVAPAVASSPALNDAAVMIHYHNAN